MWREGLITDNGNIILDLHEQQFPDPCKAERELNDVAGIVSNGLFARRPADLLLLATSDGVREFSR